MAEAAETAGINNALVDGGYVDRENTHFHVNSASLWDLPDVWVPIGIAVPGRQSRELVGPLGDGMMAIEPDRDLGTWWDAATRPNAPSREVAQLPISGTATWTPRPGGLRSCSVGA
ncbi:MAG: hypothetical protein ABIR83_11290 [Nakamurella sp.]